MLSPRQPAMPSLSDQAQEALETYQHYLIHQADLRPATLRNYVGDVRQFMAWCEQLWRDDEAETWFFSPERVATPTITRYRDYLKEDLGRKSATINRYLISLKRYFAWAVEVGHIVRDPAHVVKLVDQTSRPPRHLSDREEGDLVAAVDASASLRDRTLIILMLHTGLRVSEICDLKWEEVVIGERSGHLQIWGKRAKYREVPLNATARRVLQAYQDEILQQEGYVFASTRTHDRLTPRALGFIIKKYAQQAGIARLRPHDLRHRFGYHMADRVPLHRLAQIMGHDSLDTTLIYIRGTQSDLQRAVETIAWE